MQDPYLSLLVQLAALLRVLQMVLYPCLSQAPTRLQGVRSNAAQLALPVLVSVGCLLHPMAVRTRLRRTARPLRLVQGWERTEFHLNPGCNPSRLHRRLQYLPIHRVHQEARGWSIIRMQQPHQFQRPPRHNCLHLANGRRTQA